MILLFNWLTEQRNILRFDEKLHVRYGFNCVECMTVLHSQIDGCCRLNSKIDGVVLLRSLHINWMEIALPSEGSQVHLLVVCDKIEVEVYGHVQYGKPFRCLRRVMMEGDISEKG